MFPSVSLFTGAGGLDLGLELEGFSSRAFVEIDRDSQATLRTNRDLWSVPDAPILGDITQLTPGTVSCPICDGSGEVDEAVAEEYAESFGGDGASE